MSPLERRSAQAPPGEHDLNVAMLRQLRSSLALAEAVAPKQRQPASSPRRGYSHSPCSTVVKRGPCGVKPSRRGVRGRRGGHSHRDNAARRVVLKARASSLREVRERRGLVAGQRLSRDGAMFTGQRSEGEGGMVSPCGSATGDQVGDGAFGSAGAPSDGALGSAGAPSLRCIGSPLVPITPSTDQEDQNVVGGSAVTNDGSVAHQLEQSGLVGQSCCLDARASSFTPNGGRNAGDVAGTTPRVLPPLPAGYGNLFARLPALAPQSAAPRLLVQAQCSALCRQVLLRRAALVESTRWSPPLDIWSVPLRSFPGCDPLQDTQAIAFGPGADTPLLAQDLPSTSRAASVLPRSSPRVHVHP